MLGNDAIFQTGLNEFFTSRYATYSVLGPLSYQAGYSTLDGHLGFKFHDGHYGVQLIGRNLTNREIYDDLEPTAAGGNRVFSATLRRTRQVAL